MVDERKESPDLKVEKQQSRSIMFAMKYGKHIAVGLLILGVYAYWNSLTNTIHKQSNQITELQQSLAIEQAMHKSNINALTKEIEDQNDNIDALNELYNQVEKDLGIALERNAKLHQSYEDESQQTVELINKVERLDSCEQAMLTLKQFAPRLTWPQKETNR